MDFTKHTARAIARIGRQVQYTPVGGVATTITADFSTPPHEISGIEGFSPTVKCISSDVPNAAHGDIFVDGADIWLAVSKDIDIRAGVTEFRLELQ